MPEHEKVERFLPGTAHAAAPHAARGIREHVSASAAVHGALFDGNGVVQDALRIELHKKNTKVADLFRAWDRDGNQQIDLEEFRMGMKAAGVVAETSDYDALFDLWDTDGNGTLDVRELALALRKAHTFQEAKSTRNIVQAKKYARDVGQYVTGVGGSILKAMESKEKKSKEPEKKTLTKAQKEEEKRRLEQQRLEDDNRTDLLLKAARDGDVAEVERICQLKGSKAESVASLANSQNYEGVTPLMKAAMYGRAEVIDMLLSLGARHGEVDLHHKTALMVAAHNGEVEGIRPLLVGAGREELLEVEAHNGRHALMLAAARGHSEAVRLLADALVGPVRLSTRDYTWMDLTDSAGHTAIEIARGEGRDESSRDEECVAFLSDLVEARQRAEEEKHNNTSSVRFDEAPRRGSVEAGERQQRWQSRLSRGSKGSFGKGSGNRTSTFAKVVARTSTFFSNSIRSSRSSRPSAGGSGRFTLGGSGRFTMGSGRFTMSFSSRKASLSEGSTSSWGASFKKMPWSRTSSKEQGERLTSQEQNELSC